MYLEIQQGSKIDVQGLTCHLPPEGYVYDITSKKIEKRDIYIRPDAKNDAETYWERIAFPSWYKDVIRMEDEFLRKRKEDDESQFYDERYEQFKQQEWDRRLNGFWFVNNGKPCYITGTHYMYMQHWKIDIGHPKFRVPDLEYYYFQQNCIEDPYSMGMLEITKRRFGKTYRGGLFTTEYPTRTKNANGGIQSKTGADAKKVFAKAVVQPFKNLPRFFRPEYDMSLGVTPKSELRFQQTNVRGRKAEGALDKEELGSLIDFQSADIVAYDGQKLHRYFGDEWAKTVEANVFDRHEVIRYCLLDDEGNIIGKALYSSTVEQLESEKDGVQEAAIQLWEASDQSKKGEDGRTASGLYRFFMTADRARNFDVYGEPDVEKTVKAILADRKTVENDRRALAARKRKEARTIEEAFYAGNDRCEFNAELLQKQFQMLQVTPSVLRKIRFFEHTKVIKADVPHAKDRKIREVKWMDDQMGNWLILEEPEERNKFTHHNDIIIPTNTLKYCIGVDTFRIGHADEGSQGTICVFKKSNVINGVETGNYPVAFYSGRPKLIQHLYDEVIKACMFYGCKVNFEISAGDFFYGYFFDKDCLDLLYWTPAKDPNKKTPLKPGTESASPFELAAQLEAAKLYVDGNDPLAYNGNIDKIKFPTLIQQLIRYNHAERTPFDEVIALMMALLPALKSPDQRVPPPLKPKQLLPTYKLNV
jgi:hypothetical protein